MSLIDDARLTEKEMRVQEMAHLLACPHCDYDGDSETTADCATDIESKIAEAATAKVLKAVVKRLDAIREGQKVSGSCDCDSCVLGNLEEEIRTAGESSTS